MTILTSFQDKLAEQIEVAISTNDGNLVKELTEAAKRAKELHRSTTISSQDAAKALSEMMQHLRTGKEITLEGRLEDSWHVGDKEIKKQERFAFKKGISKK